MFKPGDFIDYFSEIEMLEKNMRDTYDEAARMVTDPSLKKAFEGLRAAEHRHADLIGEVRKIAIRRSIES